MNGGRRLGPRRRLRFPRRCALGPNTPGPKVTSQPTILYQPIARASPSPRCRPHGPISLEWCAVLRPDAAPRPGIAIMFEVAFDVKSPVEPIIGGCRMLVGCDGSQDMFIDSEGPTRTYRATADTASASFPYFQNRSRKVASRRPARRCYST
jgi:hypothetical protein